MATWGSWTYNTPYSGVLQAPGRKAVRPSTLPVYTETQIRPEVVATPAEDTAPHTSTAITAQDAMVPHHHRPLLMSSFTFKSCLRVVKELKITLEEVPEIHHELKDILQATIFSRIALPIIGAIMEPAKTIWQTPPTITPTNKRLDRKYFVPSKDSEFLFMHPSPNSLVVNVANRKNKY
ncbi:hypothetical protein UY3_14767 [Chelonia mydas]|uniref:Uncharacterized protein n=1 Tax=Chelonia mydas TaxID=8469 RepID=M7BIP9_CHEMY|nr:hypothetical protein UY3_14767 [Chelonia mydas]